MPKGAAPALGAARSGRGARALALALALALGAASAAAAAAASLAAAVQHGRRGSRACRIAYVAAVRARARACLSVCLSICLSVCGKHPQQQLWTVGRAALRRAAPCLCLAACTDITVGDVHAGAALLRPKLGLLRASPDEEMMGLDVTEHGGSAYNDDNVSSTLAKTQLAPQQLNSNVKTSAL